MAVPNSFIRAWRLWQRADRPYSSAYLQGKNTASYAVEYILDHMDSTIYVRGLAAIEGRQLNYAAVVAEELAQLENVDRELNSSSISDGDKERFQEYMSIVRLLLEEMQQLPDRS